MNTGTEYEYLSNTQVGQGLVETIIKESPMMGFMSYDEVDGNAYAWNLETAIARAGWFTYNDKIPTGNPNWVQRSTGLYRLGLNCDLDLFAKQTKSNITNQEATLLEKTAKSMSHEWENVLILGGTTLTPISNAPKGLLKLIAECEDPTTQATTDLDGLNNSQIIPNHATSAALDQDNLDALIDAIPGGPDCLIMSRRTRRKLNKLSRASGTPVRVELMDWGARVSFWDHIPIFINDFIPENFQDGSSSVLNIAAYDPTTTRAAGYDNSMIFAMKFGSGNFWVAHNGGLQKEDLGIHQEQDSQRKRLKWYLAPVMESIKCCAALINFCPTD